MVILVFFLMVVMQTPRSLAPILSREALHYPAIALIGPRQCGKTTLAKQWLNSIRGRGGVAQYFDLEKPSDRMKLASDPEAFLRRQEGTVCLDEVQYAPALFEVLRSLMKIADRGDFSYWDPPCPHY